MPIPLRPSSIAAIGLAVLATASAARTQDQTDWNAAVVKACEHRRYAMRRAVSKRIAQAGAEAVPAIRAYAEANGDDKIPMLLVSAIATDGTRDPEVVALLEGWARKRTFYWRAQALGGLVDRGLRDRFYELYHDATGDPSHLYRFEGMRGAYRGVEDRDWLQDALDDDPDPRLRIRLACFLAEQGHDWGYPVLLGALKQRNVYLGDPWGVREARRALAAATAAAGGQSFGYDINDSVDSNAEAIAGFRDALSRGRADWRDAGLDEMPTSFTGGISVRSCRNGDLFLRWNEHGMLFWGLLGRRPTKVPDASYPALHKPLGAIVTKRSVSGKVVCDFIEVVHGPHRLKCAPGAVPEDLAAWLQQLVTALGETADPEFGEELQSRLGQFADGR